MKIILHPHARERLLERGGTRVEVEACIRTGKHFDAKFGRLGFRKEFLFNGLWQDKKYRTKELEVYCVKRAEDYLVVTVIVKYF